MVYENDDEGARVWTCGNRQQSIFPGTTMNYSLDVWKNLATCDDI